MPLPNYKVPSELLRHIFSLSVPQTALDVDDLTVYCQCTAQHVALPGHSKSIELSLVIVSSMWSVEGGCAGHTHSLVLYLFHLPLQRRRRDATPFEAAATSRRKHTSQ
ncbi:hypothetical protein PM082_014599 [Marasmius tenuissimus]|nr:hypothetical protein PM082_014599 [Marasmius tenuissimus]